MSKSCTCQYTHRFVQTNLYTLFRTIQFFLPSSLESLPLRSKKDNRMKKKQKNTVAFNPTPTEQQYTALNQAFQYFNQVLFEGKLPGCFLVFSRKRNAHGYMAASQWRRVNEDDHTTHEIALTRITLYREPIKVFSTLVHEQAHLWQIVFGSPSRSGYHNKEWADKMEEIGLMPSDTGQPGGKKTGQHMTHYIIPGGKYEQAFEKMPQECLLPFTSWEGDLMKSLLATPTPSAPGQPSPPPSAMPAPAKNKTKYACPGCKVNVWGKPNLKIICGSCNEPFAVV